MCEYKKITSDERKRMLIQTREDAWRDKEARKKATFMDGKAEGMKEGEKKGNIEIAKKMILKNKNISEIIEFTGLSDEDINNLR